ncbi:MAG: hypothetical protein GW911_21155 [Armatimonadetes bacterium]|nr:hypothetical protein [Armatimonadota bacterium]
MEALNTMNVCHRTTVGLGLALLAAYTLAHAQPPQPNYDAEAKAATAALAAGELGSAARHARSAAAAAAQTGDRAKALDLLARAESAADNKADALAAYAFVQALVPASYALSENVVNYAPALCRAVGAPALIAAVEALARGVAALEATVPQALVGIAYLGYHRTKDYATEKELCGEVLKRYPKDRPACARANHYTGCALLAEGQYEQAYATFRANAKDYGDQRGVAANSLHMIVWGLSQHEKKPQEALAAVAAVFESFPDQAWVLDLDAPLAVQSARQVDDKDAALGQLQRLVDLCQAPNALVRLCADMANLCTDLGRFAEARTLLEKGETADRNPRALAEAWERLDDKAFDREDADEGLRIVRRRIGREKLDDAERIARALVEASPGKALSHVALGDVHRTRRDDETAEREYRRALTLDAGQPEAHFGVAIVYERTGREELAWRKWDPFLARAHDDSRALAVRHGWVIGDSEKLSLPRGRRSSPAFSPDGRRLAYSKQNGNHWDLCALDLATVQETLVAKCPDDAKGYHVPVWTPDGWSLVFDVDFGWPNTDLLIVPADGSAAPKPFLPDVTKSYNARFTLDGKQVTFAGPDNSVWIADADGRNPKQLIHKLPWGEMVGLSTPQLLPDGERLLCSASRDQGETYDLYAVELAEPGKYSLLATGDYQIRYALLSPNARSLVFARSDAWHKKEDKRHLWIMPADGNATPQKLVDGTFEWEAPAAWSPDGRKIVYATKAGGEGGLRAGGRLMSSNEIHVLTLAGLPSRSVGLQLSAGDRGIVARVTCRANETIQVVGSYQAFDAAGVNKITSGTLTKQPLSLRPQEVVEWPVVLNGEDAMIVKVTAVTDGGERVVRLASVRK